MQMPFCVTIHHREVYILLLAPTCDDRLLYDRHWYLANVDSGRQSSGLGDVDWTLTLSHGKPTRTDYHFEWRETVFDFCSIAHRIYDCERVGREDVSFIS